MPDDKKNTAEASAFQSVKGMHDILPKDGALWRAFITKGFEIADLHDFHFMETPILEQARLFEVGVGASTDIVEKEMFVFTTRGKDRVALRPEGTAGLMRSYIQHHLGHFASPLKVFHFGPSFRYERPQAGRYRQFHQWDFDIVGDGDGWYDVQVILVVMALLDALSIKKLALRINTIGCKVCRPNYRKQLVAYYKGVVKGTCKSCCARLEKNPMRLLDCKEEKCAKLKEGTPVILNYLCQSCNWHFKSVLELIEDEGLDYKPDPFLVRGLDYYNKTVFEVVDPGHGDFAFAGGGRYDYLGEILGNRVIPAVGAAFGVDRVIEYLKENGIEPKVREKPSVFFVAVGDQAKKAGVPVMRGLRAGGVRVREAVGKKAISAQLKSADKAGARVALIIGQRECFEKKVIVRDMKTGAQETIKLDNALEEIKKRLKSEVRR